MLLIENVGLPQSLLAYKPFIIRDLSFLVINEDTVNHEWKRLLFTDSYTQTKNNIKIDYTQEAVERKALEVISKSLGYLISPLYSLKITTLF